MKKIPPKARGALLVETLLVIPPILLFTILILYSLTLSVAGNLSSSAATLGARAALLHLPKGVEYAHKIADQSAAEVLEPLRPVLRVDPAEAIEGTKIILTNQSVTYLFRYRHQTILPIPRPFHEPVIERRVTLAR